MYVLGLFYITSGSMGELCDPYSYSYFNSVLITGSAEITDVSKSVW
jgi:hypothetical protein